MFEVLRVGMVDSVNLGCTSGFFLALVRFFAHLVSVRFFLYLLLADIDFVFEILLLFLRDLTIVKI